jgi:hypothetical protein
MNDPRLTDEPQEPSAVVDPDRIPDIDLRVGDGDGFTAVLAVERDRLVIGTAPAWDRAILVCLAAAALALVGGFAVIAFAHGLAATMSSACSLGCVGVGLLCGSYLGRNFRRRFVIDARNREIVCTWQFGTARRRIYADAIPDVVIGQMYFIEETDLGWQLTDQPAVLSVVLDHRKGRTLTEIEGVPSTAPESVFYLAVAAQTAVLLRIPLAIFPLPKKSDRSVRALWKALVRADQRDVDDWAERHGLARKRFQLIRPELVYGLLALTALLAAVCGLRWLSVTHAVTAFGWLLTASILILAGAALIVSGNQPGLQPSGLSFAMRLIPLNNPGIGILIGAILAGVGVLQMLIAMGVFMIIPPAAVTAARERQSQAERDRPSLTYRVETRPDGSKDVILNVRNMKPIDVGLELLTKPELEVREKGVRELEFHVDRKHPRRADVVAGLTPYLQSDKNDIRRIAANALGKWGFPDTIPTLEPHLRDPDERVRNAAKDAIREIGARQQRGER